MEVHPDRNPHARSGAFTRIDRLAAEVEVSQFLGDVVRLLKPNLVVETGTYLGDTARHIGVTLYQNHMEGFPGRLITFETDKERAQSCSEQLRHFPVKVINGPCWEHEFPERVDIAFIDSAYDTRRRDIEHLAKYMSPMGVMFLHDMALQGPWKGELWDFVTGKLNMVQFATPRGLAVLQPRGGLWSYGRAL